MALPQPSRPAAVVLTLPAEVVDLMAGAAVGTGVELGHTTMAVDLPMLGPTQFDVGVHITGVRVELHQRHDHRLLLHVDGRVAVGFGDDAMVPAPPEPLHVTLTAIVAMTVEVGASDLTVVIDLPGAEFVEARVVSQSDGGFDPFAQMGEMLLGQVGGTLFAGLADGAGPMTQTLPGFDAVALGVARGPAEVKVGDGVLVLALPVADSTDRTQSARAVASSSRSASLVVGVSVAGAAIGPAVEWAGRQLLNGVPLPFEVESAVEDGALRTRVRNTRVLPAGFPDLRPGLRSALHIAVESGHVVMRLREAWLESPVLPSQLNRFNRQVGAFAASMTPQRLLAWRVPAVIGAPIPGTDDTWPLRIDAVTVRDGRVDVLIDVAG